MKYPFKLSKTNLIIASIIAVLIVGFQVRVNGLDAYSTGTIVGSLIVINVFAFLFAYLFWFILGKKKGGGTTTFTIVSIFCLFSVFNQMVELNKKRQKPITDLQNALAKYKNNMKVIPDSAESNYKTLSSEIKSGITAMINTSYGEEKRALLILKNYIHARDSILLKWNDSYNEAIAPPMLDFSLLENISECDRQIKVINYYISNSIGYKRFFINQVPFFKYKLSGLNQNNETVKGFMTGIIQKDSVQKIFFIPYITAHIEFGNNLLKMVELLKVENGKWKIKNNMVLFEKSDCQGIFDAALMEATKNEEVINELSDKLLEVV
jgi:hypothetical protein